MMKGGGVDVLDLYCHRARGGAHLSLAVFSCHTSMRTPSPLLESHALATFSFFLQKDLESHSEMHTRRDHPQTSTFEEPDMAPECPDTFPALKNSN
mmetsp:Transcript_115759/g.210674  ORF Transcript_115759/g.210674 Transcript_115759/m.210674 type:complete len:96 (-) Transcript_115759:475-762(-)